MNTTLTKFKDRIENLRNYFREIGNVINAAEELYDHLNMDRSNLETIERKIKYIESSSENMEILIQLSDKYMEQRLEFDEELSILDKISFMNEDSLNNIRISMLEVTEDEGHRMFNRLLRERFSRVARQQEILELLRDFESSCLRMKAENHIDDSNDDDLVIVSDRTVSKPANIQTNNSSSKDWQPTSQSLPRKQHGDLEIDDDDDDEDEEEAIRKVHFKRGRDDNYNSTSRRSFGGTLQMLNQKSQQQQQQQIYGELDLKELEKLRSSMPEREFNKLYAEMTSYPRETRSSTTATTHKLHQKSVNNYFRRKRNADDREDEEVEEDFTNANTQKRGRRASMRNPYKGTDLEDFIVNDDDEDVEYDDNLSNNNDEQDNVSRKRKRLSNNNRYNQVNFHRSDDGEYEATVDAIDGSSSSDAWEDADETRHQQKITNRKKKISSFTRNNKNSTESKDHTPPSTNKSKPAKPQKLLTLEVTPPSVQSLPLSTTQSHSNKFAHANMSNGTIDLDDDDDEENEELQQTHVRNQSDTVIPVQNAVRLISHSPLSPPHSAVPTTTAQKSQAPKQQHPTPFKSPRLPPPPPLESENTNSTNKSKLDMNSSEANNNGQNRPSPITKHLHAEKDIHVQLQQLRKQRSEMYHSLTAASVASPVEDMYWEQETPPEAPVRKLSIGNKSDNANTNTISMRSTHFEPIDLT